MYKRQVQALYAWQSLQVGKWYKKKSEQKSDTSEQALHTPKALQGVQVVQPLQTAKSVTWWLNRLKKKRLPPVTNSSHIGQIDHDLPVDHLYPNLPLRDVVQDLYSTDPTQQTCPR